jgi:hypothetical protein
VTWHPDRELVSQTEHHVLGAARGHSPQRQLAVRRQLLGQHGPGEWSVDIEFVLVQAGLRHPIIVDRSRARHKGISRGEQFGD